MSRHTGTFVVISPTGDIRHVPFTGNDAEHYKITRDLVDGIIERVRLRWDTHLRWGYVNEEGLLRRMTPNPLATRLYREQNPGGTLIVGTLAIWVPANRRARNRT